jgi:mannose-6-phosphate isomerase-like protein (cupin superfamily)
LEYVRRIDLAALPRDRRVNEPLIEHGAGVTGASVGLVTTPPGEGSPAGLHTHAFDQVFYVLAGTMSVVVDGSQHEAGPGTLVIFPAGMPHRNWNAGSEPTVHLAINASFPDPAAPFAVPVRESAPPPPHGRPR